MSTWVGALVETKQRKDLAPLLAKHGITLSGEAGAWLLVQPTSLRIGHLGPPPMAETLSRELDTRVIAFALQTTASVEELEVWESGRRVRHLACSEGEWTTFEGAAQAWEGAYFFADGQGVDGEEEWPDNLRDEVTDEELARYRKARKKRDASTVMDMLLGGSADGLLRLCVHLGVDPDEPGAGYDLPKSHNPRLVVAAIVVFLIGMFVLGMLTGR